MVHLHRDSPIGENSFNIPPITGPDAADMDMVNPTITDNLPSASFP